MNYLMLNNRKINLTDEQVKEIEQSFGLGRIKLSDIAVGETFKIGHLEFIVLEHGKETTAAILAKCIGGDMQFGKNNNYQDSYVDAYCNSFASDVEKLIGKKNLIEHTVDLTADDGLKDYGKIKRKASLLTANLYRRYVEILDKFPLKIYWWLATAYSTPTHKDATWVKCVSPSGNIDNCYCYDYFSGVRPFCIFNSSIFVSK